MNADPTPPRPVTELVATVIGSPDPRALAAFYQRLLGWTRVHDEPDWVMVRPATGGPGLSFQLESQYVPPVWPAGVGDQHMMSHLDIYVEDLGEGVGAALAAGAALAEFQPQEHVRVMLDPDGHPFCLFDE